MWLDWLTSLILQKNNNIFELLNLLPKCIVAKQSDWVSRMGMRMVNLSIQKLIGNELNLF